MSESDIARNRGGSESVVFAVSATPAIAVSELDTTRHSNSSTLGNGYESKDLDHRLRQLQQQQIYRRRLSRNSDL